MPPRIARSHVPNSTSSSTSGKSFTKNSKGRKRNLNAYSIASHSTKERKGALAKHRLGEVIDDAPPSKSKRRRGEDGEDDGGMSDEEEEENPRKMRKRGPGEENDDGVEYGSDSEGNEWTMGGLAEDDEDSDLDSDEAFGESDEERFEGFTFRGSSSNKNGKKKKTTKKVVKDVKEEEDDIDLDEGEGGSDEEEEEDDFGEEGVDLATMLDDDDEAVLGGKDNTARDLGEESASDEEDEDEEDESDEDSEDDMVDEGDDEERVARLRDRLENLDEKPSTATTMDVDTALSVDDLLADLDPAAKAQYAAALKTKKKSSKPTTLTAPLPKRQQDKLDREVATKKAKDQLDRWRDTVLHNRRAEHLSFPLQDPNRTNPLGKDKFLQGGKPQNELEANIRRIMEESGMASKPGEEGEDDPEAALIKSEELATNKLPVEEVMQRRADLRRARELLFREEIKAKRIAKIKSKSYRRVHRKEKERQEQKERELLDPEGLGMHLDEDERETIDRKRAEERMSIKHRDSKWAKSMKATNRTVWDEGARDSVHEQARRNEELKRRIAGQEVGDSESDVPSDEEYSNDDKNDQHTIQQLGRLENEDESKEKGIAGMKFMKAADARRKAQNDQDVRRMRKELGIEDGDESESGAEINDQGLGRAIFGPKGKERPVRSKQTRGELEEGEDSGDDKQDPDDEITIQTEARTPSVADKKQPKKNSGPLAKGQASKQKNEEPEQDQGLSWLAGPGAKKSKKDRQRDRAADIDTLIVTQPEQAKQDAPNTKSKSTKDPKATSSAPSTEGWTTIPYKTADASSDSDPEPTSPLLAPSEQRKSYHARAFATDDIQTTTDFALEKSALTTAEDDQTTSTHLPGWGSWTGSALPKSIRKANARAKHNPLFKTRTAIGVNADKRKDKGLENVIISEKRDRKGGKYLAGELPHGFEKGEQYERSLRIPVGPEWSTKEVFQRGTRPRVVVKQGVVEAMERPVI